MKQNQIPMSLQLFAEGDGSNGGNGNGTTSQVGAGQNASQSTVQVDYEKIQQMLNGTLAAKEDTALKAYFKQQGLSQEEAEQAMATFKQEKAKNQPDVGALQSQLTQALNSVNQSKIENAAILSASGLGIDAKTIPYILKMADFTSALSQDGKINEEEIAKAINKVLEDIPALKPQNNQPNGFTQVGGSGGTNTPNNNDALRKAFGL